MRIRQLLFGYVKYIKFIYVGYYYVGSFFLRLLRLFIVPQDNLILFVSYGGRKYDDSPRCIYEAMLRDKRFDRFEFVWAFSEPEKYVLPRGRIIKIDTLNYFVVALKARCWVTNSAIERGLSFKGKHTFYFNTWHGVPIKRMGKDMPKRNTSFNSLSKSKVDVLLAQGEYDVSVLSRSLDISLDKFQIIGLPRNDELSNYDITHLRCIKEILGIPCDKKVILYAPTFREYDKKNSLCQLNIPIDFAKWRDRLGDKYVVLFRAHYEVVTLLDLQSVCGFVWNVSEYSYLNDLMLVSDILISDYSSIFFDYSIMGKPMICFAYDYARYSVERGLYFDIRKELSDVVIENEDQLLEAILHLDYPGSEQRAIAFRNKYVTEYGHATEKCLDFLSENIL